MSRLRSVAVVAILGGAAACRASARDAAGPDPSQATRAAEPTVSSQHRESDSVDTGQATYYSDALAGRATASGERYDPRAFTAAHRTLPFGTVVRVVRSDDGRSVVVRINDRGPFSRRERIIDLSRAAAEAIEMTRAGVVPVRLEVVERR